MVAVAVAANFIDVHHELARRFEELTGHRATTSSASTGQLYAQIVNGAPFDVFLAADAERPRLLEEADLAVPGSRFTYAVGRLALYGPGLDSVRPDGADLVEGTYTHLAIANPATAPYGAAAEEVILAIGIGSVVRPRRFRARASRRRSSSSVPARPSCHPGLNQAAGRFTVSRLGQPDSLTPLPTPPGMSR